MSIYPPGSAGKCAFARRLSATRLNNKSVTGTESEVQPCKALLMATHALLTHYLKVFRRSALTTVCLQASVESVLEADATSKVRRYKKMKPSGVSSGGSSHTDASIKFDFYEG